MLKNFVLQKNIILRTYPAFSRQNPFKEGIKKYRRLIIRLPVFANELLLVYAFTI